MAEERSRARRLLHSNARPLVPFNLTLNPYELPARHEVVLLGRISTGMAEQRRDVARPLRMPEREAGRGGVPKAVWRDRLKGSTDPLV